MLQSTAIQNLLVTEDKILIITASELAYRLRELLFFKHNHTSRKILNYYFLIKKTNNSVFINRHLWKHCFSYRAKNSIFLLMQITIRIWNWIEWVNEYMGMPLIQIFSLENYEQQIYMLATMRPQPPPNQPLSLNIPLKPFTHITSAEIELQIYTSKLCIVRVHTWFSRIPNTCIWSTIESEFQSHVTVALLKPNCHNDSKLKISSAG